METLKQIIEKLEATRIEKNLSYDEVAKMIESSKSSIWKVLTGLSIPNADTLLKLIDCLGYDFKVRKKSTIENFLENVERISNDNFKGVKPFIPENLVKGNWIEESGKLDKKLIDKISKRKQKDNIQLDSNKKNIEITKECPNCKYSETASGLRIKILKCDNCKTKKK